MYNLDIIEYIRSISYFYNYNNHTTNTQKQLVPTYLSGQERMIILNSSHVVLYMCQTCIHVGHLTFFLLITQQHTNTFEYRLIV